MQQQDMPTTGWAYVAQREAAAEVFDALLRLESDDVYTKTELAEAADVPLKTLYVNDWLSDLVDLGVLSEVEVDEEEEACYCLEGDSDLLEAAATFDDAFATARD